MTEFDYELLDCGAGRRLERFGRVTVDRPAPQAKWEKGLSPAAWDSAQLVYRRPGGDGGSWQSQGPLPEAWQVAFGAVKILLRPSANGQLGIFPEQYNSWQWLRQRIARRKAEGGSPPRVLNAFAYTGAATLAAARAGAELCHLDSAKTAVQAARRNAEASGLAAFPIRWLVEDTMRFMDREIKRGNRYDGFILDPPAFGRGGSGRSWSLRRDLPKLLETTGELLSDNPLFILLSCHDPGISEEKLETCLTGLKNLPPGRSERLPLTIPSTKGNSLPCGVCARWYRE